MLYRLLRGKSVCYQVGVLRMTAKTLILVATPLLKCFVLLATPCGKFENKKISDFLFGMARIEQSSVDVVYSSY